MPLYEQGNHRKDLKYAGNSIFLSSFSDIPADSAELPFPRTAAPFLRKLNLAGVQTGAFISNDRKYATYFNFLKYMLFLYDFS